MDREWLEAQLTAGRSIEEIARETGRHPSTVAYWVGRYGLESGHAERHRPRGGIARETLEELIDEGLSIREMAERLDRGYSTVRHWLGRYGLSTPRGRRLAATREMRAERLVEAELECPHHGVVLHRMRGDGSAYRCLACRSEAVVERRRMVKALLVAEHGGACVLCGYDRSLAALQFHHLDPGTKSFELSGRGVTRSLDLARAEARRCVLLCATCHAEVEAGISEVPCPPEPTLRGSSDIPG